MIVLMLTFSAGAAAQSVGSTWTDLGVEFAGGETDSSADIVGDTYVLPSSGLEVVIGEGVDASDPTETDVQDQIIVSTSDGIGAVAAIPAIGFPARTLEAYVGGFGESMDSVEELDLQESRGLATGVYRVVSGGAVQYMVISVNAEVSPGNHVIEVVVAGANALEPLFEDLSANVSIDGVAMFADLDVEHALEIVAADDSV